MAMEILLTTFFTLQHQIKLYHWATMDYGIHKALDELHSSFSGHVDKFVEVYLGRFKKQPLPASLTVQVKVQADVQKIEKFLDGARESLRSIAQMLGKETQLLNILDEMQADLDQTAYLIRLK